MLNVTNVVLFVLFVVLGTSVAELASALLKDFRVSVPVGMLFAAGLVLMYVYLPAEPCDDDDEMMMYKKNGGCCA